MAVRGGCIFLVKVLLFIFNFILWAGGGCLFGYALYLRLDLEIKSDEGTTDLSSLSSFFTALYVLMGTGGIIMVIGFLGCCGAIKENVCQLTLYFISIFIVIGAEIACGVWVYLNQEETLSSVSEIIDETYTKDFKKIIDLLQTKLQCCGVHGPEDWTNNDIPIPESCGNQTCTDCDKPNPEIQSVGCSDRIKQYITTVAVIVGGIILLQVLVIVLSIILCRAIRDADDYDDDDKSFS